MGLRTLLGLKKALVVPAVQETRIVFENNGDHPLKTKIVDALRVAIAGEGDIPSNLLEMDGMSGRKYRRFINALMAGMNSPSYLEIGCYKGSTACCALFGNRASATLIDNWSQFNAKHDVKEEFYANLAAIASSRLKISVLEQDFRSVDAAAIGSHNVYLFDGPHNELDQYDGIARFQDALAAEYVLIVDDWNWSRIRAGTRRAMEATGNVMEFSVEVRTTNDGSHPRISGANSDWHNGYLIAAVTKSN